MNFESGIGELIVSLQHGVENGFVSADTSLRFLAEIAAKKVFDKPFIDQGDAVKLKKDGTPRKKPGRKPKKRA